MNDQFFENDSMNDSEIVFLGAEDDLDGYEVTEAIQQRAKSAMNFALTAMIISGALFLILIGSFLFSLVFPSVGYLAIITVPISIGCTVLEAILLIGAIILNIIALVNAGKQRKEFALYKDGPEKDALESKIKMGRIFTYIGVAVAALAIILIGPLNFFEFVLAII